jgi:hypothetical protein
VTLRRAILGLWVAACILSLGYELYHFTASCTNIDGQIWCHAPADTDPDLSGGLGLALTQSIIFGLLPPTIIMALLIGIWFLARMMRRKAEKK